MRDDFNDRFREHFEDSDVVDTGKGMPRWIIAIIAVLIIAMAGVIIMGTVFIVKLLDTMLLEDTGESSGYSEEVKEETYEHTWQSSGSSLKDVTDKFKFGTVDGTTYYSEFSGVSFKATSDWSLSSYANKSYVNTMAPKDMSASNSDMSCSVVISYAYLSKGEEATDELAKQIKLATQGANNSMVNDSVTASFGGNQFTGILYKKDMEYMSYYIQALVAEVNGYALEIYIEAPTEAEIQTIMSMFK